MGRFIDPSTDWGFKHIFGKKEFLIDFLNSLLQGEHVITDVRYLNNERQPEQMEMRKVIYDIFCETDTGEHIIVEMQNRWQEHFKDRALFYMSRSIVQQGVTGSEWDYNLTAVYGVFFINFLLDKNQNKHFYKDVLLTDRHTGEIFNKKFRQIYIEMPRFVKTEADCENFLEYWIYNLVNMHKMEEISFKDKKAIFDRLEKVASQANLSQEERRRYEEEWKIYNDYFNTIESAKKKAAAEAREEAHEIGLAIGRKEGLAEGRAEGRAEGEAKAQLANARKMKEKGYPIADITDITGLSPEEIEKL
ncbi:MAG: Rpn family recombination-promoting nuclease/putative transposase [Bacteroides sp.]|nr:Rpn family recombination-promoting nuclease/putative transposase [Bacteroides sp.]